MKLTQAHAEKAEYCDEEKTADKHEHHHHGGPSWKRRQQPRISEAWVEGERSLYWFALFVGRHRYSFILDPIIALHQIPGVIVRID